MDRDTITRTGARAPGVERLSRSHGGAASAGNLDAVRGAIPSVADGTKDGCKPCDAQHHPERRRSTSRPWSRTGENPPYGILGRTMETSASFEARSAPSSYPTIANSARRSRVVADLRIGLGKLEFASR